MSELSETISWSDALEKYFSDTGEKAHCLSWIHKRSEEIYATRRTFIDLPVIVGSGVIAFLNAGSSSLFEDARISSVALGVGSLVVGIMNTLGTYFGWARRAEQHRLSSIQYARLYRFLNIEMNLPREERMTPADLLKYTKDSYDRLQEISPLIPPSVIAEFKHKFGHTSEISKPEEANGLEKISVYEPPKRQNPPPSQSPRLGAPFQTPPATVPKEPEPRREETVSLTIRAPPLTLPREEGNETA